jgi:hypothetical protein
MCELSGELIGSVMISPGLGLTEEENQQREREGGGAMMNSEISVASKSAASTHLVTWVTGILDRKGGQAKANTTIQMMQGDECVERDEGKGGQVGREDALLLQATSNRVST